MSSALPKELEQIGLDSALLPHAMRYFVAVLSEDRPAARMREDLLASGVEAARIDRATELLGSDPSVLEAASLAILQGGFTDDRYRDAVIGALGAAQVKLPVIEVGLVAIVAVYGMWLTATKGRKSHQHVIRKAPDGSWEESETTEWYGPSGPLEAIGEILGLPNPAELEAPELDAGETDPSLDTGGG